MQKKMLFSLLLAAAFTFSLHAQSCDPLGDPISLGGDNHDNGFQGVDPSFAAVSLNNGNFVVSWESRNAIDGDQGGAFFQVFRQDGMAITDVITPYADINAAGQGDQGLFAPKVIALQSGFVITWESENGPGDTGPSGGADLEAQDVFFRVYNDNGEAISASVRLDNNNREDILEYILPLTNGGFAMLASIGEDGSGNTDDFFIYTFDAQGQQLTGGPVNISDSTHDGGFQMINKDQAMAALPDGRFAVTWEARGGIDGDGTGVFLRIFNADGSALTSILRPDADSNPTGAGNQALFGSRVIALANGNLAVAFTSEGGPRDESKDIIYRVYDANGNSQSESFIANFSDPVRQGSQNLNSLIPLSDGNFAILYQTEDGRNDYYFSVINGSNGQSVSNSTEISGGIHTEVLTTVPFRNVGFIPLSNGSFAIGWTAYGDADGDNTGVYYRIFNASGTAQIPATLVYSDINAEGTGTQSLFGPILEALEEGFVVAWESEGGPGDVGKDVYHRVINNDGTPFCGTTKTNSGNDAISENLSFVQPLDNGNFVVIYSNTDAGNTDDLFLSVTGVEPAVVCPTIGDIISSPNPICVGDVATFTVTGLENMAQADNGEQDYGISFIQSSSTDIDPYTQGTLLGTVSFENLEDGGTSASIELPALAAGEFNIYARLFINPSDETCRPFSQGVANILNLPNVTFTVPEDIFEDAGVQTGLGGGMPTGGIYSGPGVTDDGNGMTFSFDPAVAGGVGNYTITYTFTAAEGCEGSASDDITVLERPLVITPISDIDDVDASGVALSIGQEVALQGVVHCADFESLAGYNFFMIDSLGDGILVSGFGAVSGYLEPTEGDEILVEGVIDQFEGQLEIAPNSITLISQGNELVGPILVIGLDESLEGKYVDLEINNVIQEDVELIDFENGNFNLLIPTPQDTFTIFLLGVAGIEREFIEEFLALNDIASYTITGLVTQVDDEIPFDDGYTLVACSELGFDFVSAASEPAWANELLIFPNPTSYEINISAPVNIEQLRVMNTQGRLVRIVAIENITYTLDMSSLPNGVYQIQLINEAGLVNRQIVKQ